MQFILPFLYTLCFVFLIYKLKFFDDTGLSRMQLTLLFGIKLMAAASVLLLYTYYYPVSDFQYYFSDSTTLLRNVYANQNGPLFSNWTSGFDNVLYNSSKLMIILNAGLHLFSFGNYYVHVLFFCFFSYLGSIALLKSFFLHFPSKKTQIIIAIFLIPSVLFWGSGPLKESVCLGCVGFIIYWTDFGLRQKYSALQLIGTVLFLLLLAFLKVYVLFALLPVLCVNYVVSKTSLKFLWFKYVVVFVLFGMFCTMAGWLNSDYNILRIISDKQATAISEARGGFFLANDRHFVCVDYETKNTVLELQQDSIYKIKPGGKYMMWELDNMSDTTFVVNSMDTSSYRLLYAIEPSRSVLEIKRVKPTIVDFLMYSPVAFMNTLAHPTFFEVNSWLHLAMAIENMWLLILIVLAICFMDKQVLKKKEVILFAVTFSVILFVLIGITTPVIGAMVRYRTIAVLFIAMICLLLIDNDKLKNRISKLKK